MKTLRLGSVAIAAPESLGDAGEADDVAEDVATDSFAVAVSASRRSSASVSGPQLARILATSPRVETNLALEEHVGVWLQALAKGEVPAPELVGALRAQVTAHGVLALVVIEGWEHAISAELPVSARAAFHAAVAAFLGDPEA